MKFPKDEYDTRLKRARKLMEEAEIDALLLTDQPNIIYLAGTQGSLWGSKTRALIGLLPREGEPALISPTIGVWQNKRDSEWPDVREWNLVRPDMPNDMYVPLKNIIKEKGLTKAKIGVELAHGMRPAISPSELEKIYHTNPDVNFVDSVPILTKLRMPKSERELERMKKAADILDKAFEAALDFAREGVTDTEVSNVMRDETAKQGADRPGTPTNSAGKEMHMVLNEPARGYTLKKGDIMIFDHVVSYRKYMGDMSRQIFIGQPSKEAKRLYEITLEATKTAEEDSRPGMTASEIDALATNVYKKHDVIKYQIHRLGHSMGQEVHELPSFDHLTQTVVLENTVWTAEPGLYSAEIGQFRVEDAVVLKKNGCELLNKAPRELDEIIR